ncbi:hypothetical protein JW964_19660, partial [candidate division KSB1 bacterium]|nr:hypothetical protein [candidate division KSB1 bacterium]
GRFCHNILKNIKFVKLIIRHRNYEIMYLATLVNNKKKCILEPCPTYSYGDSLYDNWLEIRFTGFQWKD